MAKKQFDYQFEDIRREDTPVSAAGFGAMVEEPENPDEAFVEVDLDEEDTDKAVSAADTAAAADAVAGDDDGAKKDGKKQRREVLDTRRKADQLEVDLAEGRAEFAGEVNSLKKEVAELKAGKEIDDIEAEYSSQEDELTAQMEQAMEDGDSKAQASVNSKLIALNTEKQTKKAAAEASVSIIEDLDTERLPADQAVSKRATQFMRDNQEWWSDPTHEDAEQYARKLDKKLIAMGFDPESDAYWTRFNHNFDKNHPDLRILDPDDIDVDLDVDPGKRKRAKSPVSQPGGAGAARRSNKGGNGQDPSKVILTAAHKHNMVLFHLDPTNPEHLASYAKEVAATNKKEAERRAAQ